MTSDTPEIDETRQLAADQFGKDLDPLEKYESDFRQLEKDGFDAFEIMHSKVFDKQDLKERTLESYGTVFKQWKEYMDSVGRHPACPSGRHVRSFADYLQTKDHRPNSPKTVKDKLILLNRTFQYWQSDPALPHEDDFNPFDLVLQEGGFESSEKKDPYNIPRSELGEIVRGVKHVRDRGIIASNLKLGMRATEVCNIELSHISLQNEVLRDHYPELGSDPQLKGHENAILIPHDIEGNKSQRPRILPLDEEMRQVLTQWLLVRPDNGEPYLFLSHSGHSQMERGVINRVWKKWFPEEYLEETENRQSVTSHYGRHRFTTYWEHQGLSREFLKYMRGDTTSKDSIDDSEAVNDYIHTYYEDIEETYRKQIFKLGL
ncbi:tyrosine-type recombinase/integrase [Natronomonas amylolytica]|uniref:tyrosine-type recombinase/integrase n=1 Tax=Natronomonas amylolytica TaxID=3108498 RepID=UPI00300A7827